MKEIGIEELQKEREEYEGEEKNTLMRHVLSHSGLGQSVLSQDRSRESQFAFSEEIETLPATDQKKSGRCWIFSASNLLREIIAKKANIEGQFEISQNYISYYDKLEKFNYQMEGVITLLLSGEKKDSRKMAFLLAGVGDGGQWDMYADIVKKYGIVPKSAFPETAQSENTRESTMLGNAILRSFAADCYKAMEEKKGEEELRGLKKKAMEKIYVLLTDSFGLPPQKFDFVYKDKKKVLHREKDMTPLSFHKEYVGEELDRFVSVIQAPTADKPYNKTYTIELVGNVVGGKKITHLNVSMDRLEELIIQQLKDKQITWFGSDVSYFRNQTEGLWDEGAFDYRTPFDADLRFDKKDMLDFHHAAMNHAMVITGVDLPEGKPTRWKIENSWGGAIGKSGYFVFTEDFFRDFVYQAAIDRKYLNEEELQALKKEPVLLPPWDPFGTLAD